MQKNGLFLVKGKNPELRADQVEEYLDWRVRYELANFANQLETARVFWRHYRDLVEAQEFPEQLRTAYVEANGHEPGDRFVHYGREVLTPGYRETLKKVMGY
ncbi:MAG TPA: hypothetical protein VIY49_05115 [Bryobacteraceae bacterium]